MRVTVYVRHSADCPKAKDKNARTYKRCDCPKWHYCTEWSPRRRSAKTRSWAEAEERARKLEQGDSQPVQEVTIADAADAYQKSIESRNLSRNYQLKLKRELGDLRDWATAHHVSAIKKLTLLHLEQFRDTWKQSAVTRGKRQERLRSFFLYCRRHGWLSENYAAFLSPVKTRPTPVVPFTKEEWTAIIRHADSPRTLAMLELLRWSGLRLGDAAAIERNRIDAKGRLLLYMAKTGQPVFVPLPPDVVEHLKAVKNDHPRYLFWSGGSTKHWCYTAWWQELKRILTAAGLPTAHPHQTRHTFAVELLLSGVPLDQVSMLLGHSTVTITARHYSAFVKARQEQLIESVMKSWQNG